MTYTYNSVVKDGISGMVCRRRPEQSTIVPSHKHSSGHSLSIIQLPASLVLCSSDPKIITIYANEKLKYFL